MSEVKPWYVWAGEYIESAMRTWGIPAVFTMSLCGMLMYFGYRHGDAFIEASIESSRQQSQASMVVAEAVVELTRLAQESTVYQIDARQERKKMVESLARLEAKLDALKRQN